MRNSALIIGVLAFSLVFTSGCRPRGERVVDAFTAMEKQSLADYQKAGDPDAAIVVLEAYITKADLFGTRGIKASSLPNLKFWAEARLPELYERVGNTNKANACMTLAVQHSRATLQAMQHSTTTNLMTPEAIREMVRKYDGKLKPRWREGSIQ